MKFKLGPAIVVIAVIATAAPVDAKERLRIARLPETTSLLPGGDTKPVWGWVDFCRRYRGECDTRARAEDIRLDPVALMVMDEVNRSVNQAIQPVTDQDHWGQPDRWDYPDDGKGDCEDYVLLKRKLLVQRGFPMSSLLITVVIDLQGAGHAVLTAKTDHGDLILDNMRDQILPWNETGYKFVKRQAQEDQNRWVSLQDGIQVPATVAASRK